MVKFLIKHFRLSIRHSCRLAQLPRSTYLYTSRPGDDGIITGKIEEIISKNPKYGCEMIHLKLRQQGIKINHKRTARIYREHGLQLKQRKRRKKIAAVERLPVVLPDKPGIIWALDFIFDSIAFNRKLKVLTVIDPVTNRSPVIHASSSITGNDVTNILERAGESRGYPKFLQCDNGPEFRSKELDRWCYERGVKILFSRPGKPIDNCHIESFNGTFRNECLNSHYFKTIKDAREIIESWWKEYNEERPQKRLKGMTPIEYESMLNMLKTNPTGGRKVG
jgi:putative transposase